MFGSVIIAEGKPFVSALLFFEPEHLAILQKQYDRQNLNMWVEQAIAKINKNLDSWQQIKKFCIITEQISIEQNHITPSYKLKSSLLQQQFASEIAKLYETNN